MLQRLGQKAQILASALYGFVALKLLLASVRYGAFRHRQGMEAKVTSNAKRQAPSKQ